MEIEKKYRIRELPKDLDGYEKNEIEQGYLCADPVVRIRRSNEEYILTYKGKYVGDGAKTAIVNNEIEMPLTKEGYEHLREKIDYFIIKKTRYLIPLGDGLTGELDVFHEKLEGLFFIEVEFKTEEEAGNFIPPTWFLEDVTFDKRFRNNYLMKINNLEELNL